MTKFHAKRSNSFDLERQKRFFFLQFFNNFTIMHPFYLRTIPFLPRALHSAKRSKNRCEDAIAWARFNPHVKRFFKPSVKPIQSRSFFPEIRFSYFFKKRFYFSKKYRLAKHFNNWGEKRSILGCYSSPVLQV